MIPRRFDSLLLRLLLAQAVLFACALVIFGALLVVERNRLVAPQYAALWAPQIVSALHDPTAVARPAFGLSSGIRRHDALPAGLTLPVSFMPAAVDFIDGLAAHGITVHDLRLDRIEGHPALWMHVQMAGTAPAWLSGYGPSMLPQWSWRFTVGVALLLMVIAGVSWDFARRVTRPLAQLRLHMQAHAHTGTQPGDAIAPMQARPGPPELNEIDAAYRLLAQRLQRNERERALLLAGVSHDLRSPLSRIRLAAEMLPESAENMTGVASITRNVDHADRLTASFLEFVRTGAVELGESVDLAQAARQAVARLERPAKELQARAPDTLWLHRAHGLLVERLIVNLIDNALKHGRAPVHVVVERDGETATLTVSDAGPGLPQEGAARLMEAFARGDASRAVPGFGLGLAIAQQIVVRLHGELSFAQHGARHQVSVSLPLHR